MKNALADSYCEMFKESGQFVQSTVGSRHVVSLTYKYITTFYNFVTDVATLVTRKEACVENVFVRVGVKKENWEPLTHIHPQ